MIKAELGVIGGSGLYDIEDLEILDEVKIKTPFGDPSDPVRVGRFGDGINIAFIARHGKGHRMLPTEVPYQANIYALKSLGVESILSVSAVGSLKEEIAPTHVVVPDQLIDRSKNRANSFFGEGIVGHVGFADPFCSSMSDLIASSAEESGATVHKGGTLVCMEGPLFSTRAESNLYRSWGASIIGMTALPEAKLAREAEICYGTLAMATDYDCWHQSEEDVSVEMVMSYIGKNVSMAKKVIRNISQKISSLSKNCTCSSAAEYAIMTAPDMLPQKTRKKLDLFYGKYWNK